MAVLERVHHLLQEEPERSEIVFRQDFTGDMQRVFALAAEQLQIAVRVTDSRANPLVWLIRSKMQHQWRAAMRIPARVPVTFESQCVAEERRIRDRLEEAVIETDVGQDEQVARIVVVLSSRVVPHVRVAAWFHSRARLAETRSGPGLLEKYPACALPCHTKGPIVRGKALFSWRAQLRFAAMIAFLQLLFFM